MLHTFHMPRLDIGWCRIISVHLLPSPSFPLGCQIVCNIADDYHQRCDQNDCCGHCHWGCELSHRWIRMQWTERLMHWISGAWGGSLIYAGTTAFPNCEVRRLTKQPPLTTIIQKRRLTLFGHLVRMDESADARRILTAVHQSEWRRPVERPYTSWMATLKNDLAWHNLTLEDAIELALNKPLWRLLAASGATHWWCMPNNDDEDEH